VLTSAGSDRIFDLWVDETLAACDGKTTGAPTRASFTGEADAVSSFAEGLTDIAYTGLGYGDGTDLVEGIAADKVTRRAEVMVPIALNAAVIAVGNGRPDPSTNRKVPYSDVKLTLTEVATLLGGGHYAMDPHLDAIYERNPELKQTGFFDTNSDFKVGGPAGGDAGTWLTTSTLRALRPNDWKVPEQATFGGEAGKARSASASLATAAPSFQTALSLFAGRPVLKRSLNALGASDYGGVYVLTDLATANAFHLTPVQIENSKGDFVAPTPASISAAVPRMAKTANNTLVADPAATADSGAEPYPLSFVEYAMVPAEPLHDDAPDCAARSDSQTVLKEWLTYLIGPGQAKLAAGFVPLPDALKTEASAAVAKVGAAKATGACARAEAGGELTTSTTGATTTGSTPEVPADDPVTGPDPIATLLSGVPTEVLPVTTAAATEPVASAPTSSNPMARAAAALIRPVKALVDPRRIGQFWPTLALLCVLALTAFASWLTARRDTWQLF
jgi:hypothetical protein